MALTKKERKLLHQKAQQPTYGIGKPSDSDGFNGDIAYRKVEGAGTVQYLKENNSWTAISSSGVMPPLRVITGGGRSSSSSAGTGVTSHGDLTSLTDDDHTQYLLVDGTRAMTGDLSLGGGDGALTFTVAGENSIKIPDNQASALIIEEANAAYLTFTTTNSGEKMQFHKALDIDAVSDFGSNAMTNVNIDSGAIDGTTIGANSATSGAFTTITASTSIDITGSDGLILENDETITNSTNGTVLINGIVSAGAGSGAGIFQSNGDYDVTLQTGNSTTGVITITDGANGNIAITPNGSGEVDISKVDIDSGAIDGTVIGANSQAAGDFTAIGAVSAGTIVGTTIDATTDFTIGTTVITDDSIVMTPSTDDTVTIAASPNGRLSITTVDDDGANGNMTLTADGTMELDGTTITLDSSGDIVLDAAGKDISLTDGAGTAEFIFNLEDAPELDVDGAFTIDGSSDITIDAGGSFIAKASTREVIKAHSDGYVNINIYNQSNFNNYKINNKASKYHLTSGQADFQENHSIISYFEESTTHETYPS
tara:strand:- start:16469 stop:18088 length:1620 start_codon:yes stop_codon:yes gene_type:complete